MAALEANRQPRRPACNSLKAADRVREGIGTDHDLYRPVHNDIFTDITNRILDAHDLTCSRMQLHHQLEAPSRPEGEDQRGEQ